MPGPPRRAAPLAPKCGLGGGGGGWGWTCCALGDLHHDEVDDDDDAGDEGADMVVEGNKGSLLLPEVNSTLSKMLSGMPLKIAEEQIQQKQIKENV